ncbi:MAG: YtoQ family protein, partial [Parvibaculaceae bacterium]|nr:YtoQ family protein [Parvibaculaceae bacterium]
MTLTVYLSGEIHTNWRTEIEDGCKANGLDITFTSAVTNHEASDAAGDLLGSEEKNFWRDHKSAKV